MPSSKVASTEKGVLEELAFVSIRRNRPRVFAPAITLFYVVLRIPLRVDAACEPTFTGSSARDWKLAEKNYLFLRPMTSSSVSIPATARLSS